jgi:hypothetical protein
MGASKSILSKENNLKAYKILYKNHIRSISQICFCCADFQQENFSGRKKRKAWKSWKFKSKSKKQFYSKLNCKNLKFNLKYRIYKFYK